MKWGLVLPQIPIFFNYRISYCYSRTQNSISELSVRITHGGNKLWKKIKIYFKNVEKLQNLFKLKNILEMINIIFI